MRRGLVRRYMDGPVVRRGRARRQGAGLLSSGADVRTDTGSAAPSYDVNALFRS